MKEVMIASDNIDDMCQVAICESGKEDIYIEVPCDNIITIITTFINNQYNIKKMSTKYFSATAIFSDNNVTIMFKLYDGGRYHEKVFESTSEAVNWCEEHGLNPNPMTINN